jgi:NAD(P)-dependent dehydrogenase (short-subunit alcohol dehydrogenase family)
MSQAFAPNLLAGKTAFVMGGTRGMNLEIAKRYAQHGANVVVSSRSPERCESAAAELTAIGVKSLGIPCDVRDYDGVAAAMKTTFDTFGEIDIVIAGQAGNFYAPATGMSANGFKTIIDIDLRHSSTFESRVHV